MSDTHQDITELNEQTIQSYLESQGWNVEKLDLDNSSSNADFLVCHQGYCFLCEVKTIRSVTANIPYTPAEDYFAEGRNRRRDEMQEWMNDNPDKRLVMPKEEREYYFGNESEFRARYRHRQRYTKEEFNDFKHAMQEYFENSSVCNLPYLVRLDSDDCYVPPKAQKEHFFEQLERELQAIDRRFQEALQELGKIIQADASMEFDMHDLLYQVMLYSPENQAVQLQHRRGFFEALTKLVTIAHSRSGEQDSWYWTIDSRPYNLPAYYLHHQIRRPQSEYDPGSSYSLMVHGPWRGDELEIQAFGYGQLNFDAIDSNVSKAVRQLQRSAETKGRRLPRVIALAFAEGLGFEGATLPGYIAYWLREHPSLSAIAHLRWVPDGTPPPEEEGLVAYFDFLQSTPSVPRFVVYHNPWSEGVDSLYPSVFDDGLSVQVSADDVNEVKTEFL